MMAISRLMTNPEAPKKYQFDTRAKSIKGKVIQLGMILLFKSKYIESDTAIMAIISDIMIKEDKLYYLCPFRSLPKVLRVFVFVCAWDAF